MPGAEDDRFIREHEGLVTSIAQRLRGEMELTLSMDDLKGWGFQGLVEARARFDASRGVQFSTFAYYRVRGAMIDGIRKTGYVSRRAHELAKIAEAADAAAEQVAEGRATMTAAQRADAQQTAASIDEILARTTAAFVIEAVGQAERERAPGPDELVIAAESADRVRAAVDTLPEREAKVIRDFYFHGRVLDEIAADFGVSRSWVSRMHTRALGLLRETLERDA
ncbi:MAG: sigma-70 family RNA polymerase sigma factor [Sandaracinus sp.]